MADDTKIEIEDLRGDLPHDELILNLRRDNSSWEDLFQREPQTYFEESIKLWQGQHLKEPRAGRSKLFVQKPRSIVRKIGADLLDAFFSSPDFVTIEPKRPNKAEDVIAARVRQIYINHVYDSNPINWFKICYSAFDDGSVLNLIAAEVSWVKEVDKIPYTDKVEAPNPAMPGYPQIDPQTLEPVMQDEPREVELVMRDEPNVRLIPPDRVALDVRVGWEDIYAGQFIIHKDPTPYQDLLKLAQVDDKIIKENLQSASTYQRLNAGTIPQARGEAGYQFNEPHRKEIEVWKHYYKVMGKWWSCWFDKDIAVIRSPEIIQEKHGMPPIIIGFLDPESHKIYSPSKVQQNRDNFVMLNGVRNQRMDNVARIMNQHAIVNRDQKVDLASLVNRRPMGYTLVDGDPRTAVYYEQVPDIKASAYNEEVIVDRDIQELSGVNDLDQGIKGNEQELATQSVIRQQNTNKKAGVNIRMIAESFIISVTKRVLQLADDHESAKHMIEIVGDDPQVVQYVIQKYGRARDNIPSLLEIQGKFNVRVYAGLGFFSKDVQIGYFERAFEKILSFGPDAAIAMLPQYLTLLGIHNVNEVVIAAQKSLMINQLVQALTEGAGEGKPGQNGKTAKGPAPNRGAMRGQAPNNMARLMTQIRGNVNG